jgi:hypothetical protein
MGDRRSRGTCQPGRACPRARVRPAFVVPPAAMPGRSRVRPDAGRAPDAAPTGRGPPRSSGPSAPGAGAGAAASPPAPAGDGKGKRGRRREDSAASRSLGHGRVEAAEMGLLRRGHVRVGGLGGSSRSGRCGSSASQPSIPATRAIGRPAPRRLAARWYWCGAPVKAGTGEGMRRSRARSPCALSIGLSARCQEILCLGSCAGDRGAGCPSPARRRDGGDPAAVPRRVPAHAARRVAAVAGTSRAEVGKVNLSFFSA